MGEEHSRVEVGVFCLQCAGDIFECRVSEGWVVDHWYECECGCACIDCRQPMRFQERDTSSGTEYRSYRCEECGREGNVRAGVALWQAMEDSNAPTRWLTFDGVDGPKVVQLLPGEWVIGRAPECDIVVRDFGCSRRHAKFVVEAHGVWIVDLKSKSGIQVRRQPVLEARLENGDEIRLGSVMLRFAEGAEPPSPAPRASLAQLTVALERPPGSLREDTRLQELGTSFHSLMYAVHRASEAFQVKLPQDRLMMINTVGELLDLIEEARGEGRT